MSWGAQDLATPDIWDHPTAPAGISDDGFYVLGPLEVVAGGAALPLGSPAQRALLALLILRAGETVAIDTLIDALWDDRPPESAANLIQVYVARLRAVLEPDRRRGQPPRLLVTRAPGYALAVPPEQIDAHRFEQLTAQARHAPPHIAAATLRHALALWRGPVLADLPDRRFAHSDRIRLEGLRAEAMDALIDADLALGRHAELIPRLEAAVAEDPLRERAWAQLILALYRTGQQARALRAYDTARGVLADELGLDPGPPLRDLHQAILRHDPALQLTPAPPGPEAGNLPAPLTSFIGRRAELAHTRRLLGTSRLVTIIGPGGAGKTRLALQTAAATADEFRDGVWLVDLAPIRDAAGVALAVAAALGVRDQPARPITATLADYLHGAHTLLVLDNCEHLIDACADLAAALLAACPAVRILATSREALAVPGELAWPLPPLPEPEAVALFVDRAAAVDGFQPSPEGAALAAQICQRLDGIPLAIELAAARLRTLSLGQIADRLDDRFRLLSQTTRGTSARQRTLQATVDWSYDLLSVQEQALFDRLSVFAASFTLDAAEAVAGPGVDTLGLLGRLVDKSLVARADTGEDTARYRLLETLRHYGQDRLAERGGTDQARHRHAAYYLDLAEQAAPILHGPAADPTVPLWLDRLDADRAELRAALAWTFSGCGDPTGGVRLAVAAWVLWFVRGPFGEGRQLVETALGHCESDPTMRTALLYAAGVLAVAHADFERATTAGERCLALARRHGDDRYAALALLCLGSAAWLSGDAERGRQLLEETVAHDRRLGARRHLAISLAQLGGLTAERGDYARAAALLDESTQLARAVGDPLAIGFALGFRAMVAQQQHDDERAAALADQALAAYRAVGFAEGIVQALWTLAVAAERRGEHQRAAALYLERLPLSRQLGNRRWTAVSLEGLARVAAAREQPVTAARLLGAASALRAAISAPVVASERADRDRCLADVRAALGSSFDAAWTAGQALTIEQALAEAQALALR
ncbi:MAG: BTAD domain-containing putative transcriptional regulator [Egibacteraceae bacterium]